MMVITQAGQIIRTPVAGISKVGRRTQGYKVITLDNGDHVVAVARFFSEENGADPIPAEAGAE